MRCPACTTPSKVYFITRQRKGAPQPASDAIFWDEADKYHVHDARPYVSIFRCSNAHTFEKRELEACPNCKYGHEPATVKVLP